MNSHLDLHSFIIYIFRNPTPKEKDNKIIWERFNTNTKKYIYLSAHESKMKNNLRPDKVAFWNVLIPRLKNGTVYYLPVNMENQTKMWTFLGIAGTLLLGVILLLFLFIKTRMKLIRLEHWFLRHRTHNSHNSQTSPDLKMKV